MVSVPIRAVSAQRSNASNLKPHFSQPMGLGWNHLSLPATPLLGTDGIRGKAGDLLTAPLAMHIGFWAGQVMKAHAPMAGPVIVGQDSRNSGFMLAAALASGLTSAGVEVWNVGLCTTPGVAFLTEHCQCVGGIMISASHNPPEDNGIKFFGADGMKLSSRIQQQIEQALRHPESLPSLSVVESPWGQVYPRPELVDQYIQFLRQSLQPALDLSGMRIVLDMAWGAATRVAESVFKATGAEVIGLHGLPDGDRINVNCGSTHLDVLKTVVRERQADIGFAFDGDADRVMAVDAQGRVVDGDYILYFWGKTLSRLSQLPDNTIVSTVMANLGFERAWQRQGGQLIRTAVGDQHVHAEMLRRGAKLGGEQSGHILCHHYSMTGDGILTALHLSKLVQQTVGSLAQLVDDSFTPYPQLLRNVRVTDRDRRANWQNCDSLQLAIAQAEAAMGDQGRVLVRASGTEPLMRVMVEAADADLVEHWTSHLAAVVEHHLAA